MSGRGARWRVGAIAVAIAVIATACGGPAASPQGGAAPAKRIYYADSRTWPSQPELLKALTHGKFYIPIQDDGLVAVVDPEKPPYVVKLIKIAAAQPHHPWTAPGMRLMYINHQSEGKGDHNIMTVIDTFTDTVIDEIKTDFDDPFHCSFSPVKADLFLCGDLNPKGGYVYYIDPIAHKYLSKVKTTGTMARDVIQTHDGKYAFIGHQGTGNVDVLDIEAAKIVKTIPCDRCARLKMTPDGLTLLASSPPNDFTAIIDVAKQEITKKVTFPAKSGPGNINFADGGKEAMVGLGTSGKIALINVAAGTLDASLVSGKGTNTGYANPQGDPIAIVTNDGTDDHYTVIDPVKRTVLEQVESGGKATHNVQWSADGRFALGSDRLGDTVTIFSWDSKAGKLTKVASVKVGFGANGIQWVPYFCGAPFLTTENVTKVKNIAATNDAGDCPK